MSRLRITFSRLLALGGFTAISGSSFAYYRYNLHLDAPVANCKPAKYYESRENSPKLDKSKTCDDYWDDNWDLRKPKKHSDTLNKAQGVSVLDAVAEATTEPEPTATRHVVLVRHGQYFSDKKEDHLRILTELGRQQAKITGERLKSLNIKFDKIIISTKPRAQETGNIIAESLPDTEQHHCSLLIEGEPYPMEPQPSIGYPGEESFFRDNPRIEGAFRKYIHRANPEQKEDSYELLVSHGNVIRYFICRSLQFPPEGWLRMDIGHCGMTWISIRPNGRVTLRGLGDVGHLPTNMVTFQ